MTNRDKRIHAKAFELYKIADDIQRFIFVYGGQPEFHSFSGNPVYYIDKIPCTFHSIKGNIALVSVINVSDFSSGTMYVSKRGDLFAHGETIAKANEAVELKYYSTIDREKAISEFKAQFKPNTPYSNNLFYKWHTILTGSCESGKNHWLKEHGITLDDSMTVERFVELTKSSYGGDIISNLIPMKTI